MKKEPRSWRTVVKSYTTEIHCGEPIDAHLVLDTNGRTHLIEAYGKDGSIYAFNADWLLNEAHYKHYTADERVEWLAGIYARTIAEVEAKTRAALQAEMKAKYNELLELMGVK
ncbi:MAG: hypothetical protein JEZ11_03755 [Desulfobacterales bacterium]|nr:hypothetical protein [Desulfobacterales bacterium]